jgi:hypothetical protein
MMPPIGRKTAIFDQPTSTFESLARKPGIILFQFGKEKSKMGADYKITVHLK